jgi:hypothetical protein
MRSFDYARAETPQAAVAQGRGPATRFIAGGTNLLDLMKLEIETPDKLIDISRLDLTEIAETGEGGLSIGALALNSDLAADIRVRKRYPVSSRALLAGASAQLRNKATTGAICCSAPVAAISMIRPRPAISAKPARDARRSAASTECMPSWARASTASPPTHPTWPSPCAHWMRRSSH